jgi:hypothetical protein
MKQQIILFALISWFLLFSDCDRNRNVPLNELFAVGIFLHERFDTRIAPGAGYTLDRF